MEEKKDRKNNKYFFYIAGMGCGIDYEKHKEKFIYKYSIERKLFDPSNIFFVCYHDENGKYPDFFNIFNRGIFTNSYKYNNLKVNDKPMLEYIIQLISDGNEVFLFGHSFGGLIINKMCEKIQEYIKNEEKTDEKKGFLEKFLENYEKKLIVATFGSIYLPNKKTLGSININNYMHIRDIAIRLNHIRIIFDGGVPKHSDLDNNFLCKRIDKGTDKERDIIIFKYNNIDPKKRVIFF